MSPQQDNPPNDDENNNNVAPSSAALSAAPTIAPTTPAALPNSAPSDGGSPSRTSSSASPTQSHITIPALAPVGMIVMTEPPSSVQTTLYKIAPFGNPLNASANSITFGWNISSALIQPSQLTVQAACQNGFTYPVGSATQAPGDGIDNGGDGHAASGNSSFPDGVVPASQNQVVWDVVAYQAGHPETPLPQGLCTLRIADERGFNAPQRAGYLSPNTGAVTFALYTGEAYTPLASGWECLSCNTNSISSAYDSHPVLMGFLVSLLVCALSGVHVLFRAKPRLPRSRPVLVV